MNIINYFINYFVKIAYIYGYETTTNREDKMDTGKRLTADQKSALKEMRATCKAARKAYREGSRTKDGYWLFGYPRELRMPTVEDIL